MGKGGGWDKCHLIILIPHLGELPQTGFGAKNSRSFIFLLKYKIWRNPENGAKSGCLFEAEF